jgi:hypothetical protein
MADTAVRPDALPDPFDIRANPFGDTGQFVS